MLAIGIRRHEPVAAGAESDVLMRPTRNQLGRTRMGFFFWPARASVDSVS